MTNTAAATMAALLLAVTSASAQTPTTAGTVSAVFVHRIVPNADVTGIGHPVFASGTTTITIDDAHNTNALIRGLTADQCKVLSTLLMSGPTAPTVECF